MGCLNIPNIKLSQPQYLC